MLTEQTHQMLEAHSKAQFEPVTTSSSSSEVDHSGDHTHHTTDCDNNPIGDTSDVQDYDTMLYPYPRYNEEADEEAHVRTFLTTWQANHMSQRLAMADVETSIITEFRLLRDGQASNWYSQHDLGEFPSFQELQDRFI